MAIVILGSQDSDRPTTPTLRQWYRLEAGMGIKTSMVTTIFKPNKYGHYSFVTEHDFRVTVSKGSSLATALEEHIPVCVENDTSLVIEILDGEKGAWRIGTLENTKCQWDEESWGFKCSRVYEVKKPTAIKTGTTAKQKGGVVQGELPLEDAL